ncbi:MAG: DUF6036 family nucleotidyltransferase [Janthinobacterium lividum]
MNRRSEQLSLFAALNKAGADYVVVGGVAVNAHGFIRNTTDLDLYFRPTVENASAIFRALTDLSAPLDGKDPTDLLIDYAHFQMRTPYGRVDFLSSIGGMPFDQVWRGRVEEEIEGILVPFISKQDLIENKLQVGRSRDLLDVEELALLPDQQHLRLVDDNER